MATSRQIAANRRNAQKSTGPKSEDGKASVSRNALKHGLAGHGVVLPDEMTAAIEERRTLWIAQYRPDSPAERWKFDRICAESVRADVCLHQSIALRDEAARRAAESWDDDRALEAEQLGARLACCPEQVQLQLRQSRHGALWLVARWEELAGAIAGHAELADEHWSQMLDLLGVPAIARDHARPILLGDGPLAESAAALIRDVLADLHHRLDDHLNARDERARIDAQAGLAEDGPALRRASRYETQILRRMRQAEADLRRLQHDRSSPPPDRPRPPSDRGDGPTPGRSPSDPSPALPCPAPAGHPTTFDPSRSSPVGARPTASPRPTPERAPGLPNSPADAPRSTSPSFASSIRGRLPDAPSPANRRERRALRALLRRGSPGPSSS